MTNQLYMVQQPPTQLHYETQTPIEQPEERWAKRLNQFLQPSCKHALQLIFFEFSFSLITAYLRGSCICRECHGTAQQTKGYFVMLYEGRKLCVDRVLGLVIIRRCLAQLDNDIGDSCVSKSCLMDSLNDCLATTACF